MMKGWKSGVIKDYGQVVTGHTPPTAQKEYSGEGYKFVTPTDLNFMNYFVDQTGSQVTEAARKKFGKKFLPPYSVSYTCIGNTIGKACLNREWVLTNQQINSIIPSKEHDYRFIYYQLNCLKDTIVGAATGAATPIINKSKFEGIKVKYPPLPVQRKIGSLLAAYDDLIENNLKRIKLLEEIAQITYEEWFVRLHFPGHESTPINPETSLPEGWETRKVGNLIGKTPKSTKIKSSEIQNSGAIPVVDQSKDFVAGYTDDPESLINANHPVIIFGDHTRVLKFINFPFARGADGTQVIISNEERMPQHLFYHALLNLDLSDYHYARHYKFLKELEVMVSDVTVANQYEVITKEQFEAVKKLRQQNERLREARDILLPRLMTGVIDVESYDPAQLLKEAA